MGITSFSEFMDWLPLWSIYPVTLALAMLAIEAGFLLGKRWQRRSHVSKEGAVGGHDRLHAGPAGRRDRGAVAMETHADNRGVRQLKTPRAAAIAGAGFALFLSRHGY